jgi:5-deoxy-glucuronate isomerase
VTVTKAGSEHKVTAASEGERVVHVTPELAGWRSLDFKVERYGPGEVAHGETGSSEMCLVFMGGSATVAAAGHSWRVEGRGDVFDGLPYAVYLPPGVRYEIRPEPAVEVAFASAPAQGRLPARLITPEQVKVEIRGGHNATRQISHILDPGDAEHLLCVEVYTPSGNWSSYPPHKHDVQAPPEEVDLEEIYHYRVKPQDGWALQRLYNDDRSLDEVVVAQHGDTVLVRQGYHPVAAAPGYDCYYLNFLAGETPSWVARDEPRLAWVRGNWEGKDDRLRLPLGEAARKR